MKSNQGLYKYLPVSLQNLACSREGKKENNRLYTRQFFQLLDECIRRGDYNEELIIRHRDEQLRKFIVYSYDNSDYFRDLFDKLGLTPDDITTLDDLQKLPILTKAEVQAQPEMFINRYIDSNELLTTNTSGTTGNPLTIPITYGAEQQLWMTVWRFRMKHKIKYGTECAVFSGDTIVPENQKRKPFWRNNKHNHETIYSSRHMTNDNLPYYTEHLQKTNVSWLHGYPSQLALLASFILDRRIAFSTQIKHITIVGETLLKHQRKLIERAFGTKVHSEYRIAEGVAHISECIDGKFHIDEDFSAVELIPKGDNAYALIGTNFTNSAFPLIRYDTGDLVYIAPNGSDCLCGNPGRVITAIDGRIDDYIMLEDGSKIGRMDNLLKEMVKIKEAQIVQTEQGKIIYRIVRSAEYSGNDEQKLRRLTSDMLGENLKIDIDYVDSIEKSDRGKLRFVLKA